MLLNERSTCVYSQFPPIYHVISYLSVLVSQVSAYPLIAKSSDCSHSAYARSCAFLLTGPVHFLSLSLHSHGLMLSFTLRSHSLLLLAIWCWSFLWTSHTAESFLAAHKPRISSLFLRMRVKYLSPSCFFTAFLILANYMFLFLFLSHFFTCNIEIHIL